MAQCARPHSVHPNLCGDEEAGFGFPFSLFSLQLPDGPSLPSFPSLPSLPSIPVPALPSFPSLDLNALDFELPAPNLDIPSLELGLEMPRPDLDWSAPSVDMSLPAPNFPDVQFHGPQFQLALMNPQRTGWAVERGIAPWSVHPNLASRAAALRTLPTAAAAARARFPDAPFGGRFTERAAVHPNFENRGGRGEDYSGGWQAGCRWPDLSPQPELPAPPSEEWPGIDSLFGMFFEGRPELRGPELDVGHCQLGGGWGKPVRGYPIALANNLVVEGIRPTRIERPRCVHPNVGENVPAPAPAHAGALEP